MDFFNAIKNSKIFTIISIILNIILVISVITFSYLYFNKAALNNLNEENEDVSNNVKETINHYYVDIKGEVNKPGVYEVTSENIINDVIDMASGFTKNAYKNNINLSKKVSDELVIYVYSKNEYKNKFTKTKVVEKITVPCECSTYDISNCITNTPSSEIIASDKDTITTNNLDKSNNNDTKKQININTATLEELTSLSGIGNSKAKDIINYRNTNGLFKTIEDIKKISGIGDAIFKKIKDNITV